MLLLFMDAETTGLDPVIHVPWEVAAVLAEHTDDGRLVVLGEEAAFIRLTDAELSMADPVALSIGRFERLPLDSDDLSTPGEVARAIDDLCVGRPHLVGAVPSFDDRRVGDLMRRCGITPRWHYHLIDIEALAVGFLAGVGSAHLCTEDDDANLPPGPWKSDDLSLALGVDPAQFDRHTAMGDVRWCMAQYAAVFGLTIEDVGEAAQSDE